MTTPTSPSVVIESAIEAQGLGSLVGSTDDGAYLALLTSLGVNMGAPTKQKTDSKTSQSSSTHKVAGTPDPGRICKDGERTDHLVRLAGAWIQENRSIEEVIVLARGWNTQNTPPLDDQKVVSTCESILKTHINNHPGEVQSTGPISPLFDISEARVDDMLASPPPDRRWLLTGCLPYGKVGMIIAPGGTGKSMFSLQLGVSLATGAPFLGHWEIGEIGSSLMLFAEEDYEELHRRLNHVVSAMHLGDHVAAGDIRRRVFLKSMTGLANLMTKSQGAGGVVATDYAARLVMTARQIPDLKLIVIDPASRFRGGIENSAEDTTRFVEQLEHLCQQTGATVLVLHHANKTSSLSSEANQSASRGSSAMTDGVRWQLNLSKPSDRELKHWDISKEDKHKYLIAAVTKNNYGAPQPDIVLRRGDYGVLQASAAHSSPTPPLQILCDLLASEKAAGNEYSKASFEKKFGGITGPFRVGQIALGKLISEAVGTGKILRRAGRGILDPNVPPTP